MPRSTAVAALLVALCTGPAAGAEGTRANDPGTVEPVGILFQAILEVADMERQVAFYRDLLGFAVVEPPPPADLAGESFVRLATGGALLALQAGRESSGDAGPVRLSFRCTDLVAARKRLLGSDLPLSAIRSPAPGVLVVDARDPEGNRLHLEARVDPPADAMELETSARQALEGWLAAYDAGDWEGVIDFYSDAPTFHWIEEGRGFYDSKEAIRAAIESLYRSLEGYRLEPGEATVRALADDLALARVSYRQELIFAGGESLILAGTMTGLLERSTEGWRFATGYSAARPAS